MELTELSGAGAWRTPGEGRGGERAVSADEMLMVKEVILMEWFAYYDEVLVGIVSVRSSTSENQMVKEVILMEGLAYYDEALEGIVSVRSSTSESRRVSSSFCQCGWHVR